MIVLEGNEGNVFLALANAMWSRGEDGEIIARELAQAFRAIAEEGTKKHHLEEYVRLSQKQITEDFAQKVIKGEV